MLLFLVNLMLKLVLKTLNRSSPSQLRWIGHKSRGDQILCWMDDERYACTVRQFHLSQPKGHSSYVKLLWFLARKHCMTRHCLVCIGYSTHGIVRDGQFVFAQQTLFYNEHIVLCNGHTNPPPPPKKKRFLRTLSTLYCCISNTPHYLPPWL